MSRFRDTKKAVLQTHFVLSRRRRRRYIYIYIYISLHSLFWFLLVLRSFPAPFRRPRAERSAWKRRRRRRRIHKRIESNPIGEWWCCFWRRMAFKSWTNPDGGREGPKREKVRRARRINFGGYARLGIAHHFRFCRRSPGKIPARLSRECWAATPLPSSSFFS